MSIRLPHSKPGSVRGRKASRVPPSRGRKAPESGHPARPRGAGRRALLSLAVAGAAGLPAQAEDGPRARPARLLVGFAPGGGVDLLARVLAERLQAELHHPVVVENHPGQAGGLATELGMRAAPDGGTLTMANIGTMALNPALRRGYPVDPERDVAPVSRLTTASLFFFVPAALPARDLGGLVALARERPGALNYGSGGAGGITHVAAELFLRAAGVRMAHVPYRGAAPAVVDLAAGRIDLLLDVWGVGEANVLGGSVRALAVSGDARSPLAPEVPTARETGIDYAMHGWQALIAPRGTPRAVVEQLNVAVRRALADPGAQRRIEAQGSEAAPSTPEELADLIERDRRRLGEVVRALGIAAD